MARQNEDPPGPADAPGDALGAAADGNPKSTDLAPIVGVNLRKLRTQRGLSLEKLAQKSGVSRAMLGQVELGQSAPTINVLWKIARALDVTFSALISAPEAGGTRVLRGKVAKVLGSQDGSFRSRALFPLDAPRRTEFYELRLAVGCVENAEPHAAGTLENLIVSQGSATIRVGADTYRLDQGDAIVFPADGPHGYENTARTESILYLVITYAEARS